MATPSRRASSPHPRRPPVQTYDTAPTDRAALAAEVERGLRQDRLARESKAEGQCSECRAYTWDGQPPTWHPRGCSRASGS